MSQDAEYWQNEVSKHLGQLSLIYQRLLVSPWAYGKLCNDGIQHAKSLAHALEQLEMILCHDYHEERMLT